MGPIILRLHSTNGLCYGVTGRLCNCESLVIMISTPSRVGLMFPSTRRHAQDARTNRSWECGTALWSLWRKRVPAGARKKRIRQPVEQVASKRDYKRPSVANYGLGTRP